MGGAGLCQGCSSRWLQESAGSRRTHALRALFSLSRQRNSGQRGDRNMQAVAAELSLQQSGRQQREAQALERMSRRRVQEQAQLATQLLQRPMEYYIGGAVVHVQGDEGNQNM